MLKKTIIKLCIFLALLFILDKGIGYVVGKLYFMQDHGDHYRTTYVFENATPQIMILGASKASHDYITKMIQDSLQETCFNSGKDGNFILYQEAESRCILKRYTPKIMVLDINDDEFEDRAYKVVDRLSSLLPYYARHPEIRDIVDLKSPFEKYKLMSSLYTFNTMILPSITGTLDLSKKKKVEQELMGYQPLYEKWNGDETIVDSHNQQMDSIRIKAFEEIVKMAKERNIKLAVVISPAFKEYKDNYNPTIEALKKITDSSHVPLWNYIGDTAYLNHKQYFKDVRHMNDDGAKIFTAGIIQKLKSL